MKLKEFAARAGFVLIVIGLPLAVIGYQYLVRSASTDVRVIEVQASVPEAGGFQPASIQIQEGETVLLRFTSTDVTHGVAIGPGLGVDLREVDPGHTKEVTMTFEHAGTYTFYCTTWCSPNHWRMRGVIEVQGDSARVSRPQADPVIAALIAEGVDIDAVHSMSQNSTQEPIDRSALSPERGAELLAAAVIPDDARSPEWRRSHTPAEAAALLAPLNPALNEMELADMAASLWLDGVESTQQGRSLYEQNCAACHGQYGDGDGPAADLTLVDPARFTDLSYMFHMRSDVLYAKIRRGGMGTDMPNFGTVFTPEETWALVDYLWSLSLDQDSPPN
jgi:mono/diheme cytochrome c family protein/plastocyanin